MWTPTTAVQAKQTDQTAIQAKQPKKRERLKMPLEVATVTCLGAVVVRVIRRSYPEALHRSYIQVKIAGSTRKLQ